MHGRNVRAFRQSVYQFMLMPAPVDKSLKLLKRDDVGMKVAVIAPSMLYLLYPLKGKQAKHCAAM